MQAQYVVQEWRIMYRMKHRIRLRGNLKTYLRWPLFFGLLFILMTVQLFSVSVKAGIMGVFYTVIYLLIAFLINFSGRRKLKKDLIEFATNYGEMQMRMMKTLTVPFAILSDDGHMLWGNDEFVSVIVNKKAARRNISNIFEEITIDSLPDSDEIKVIHVKTEDKYYRAVMKLIVSDSPDDEMVKTDINQLMDNSRLISVFLYDETDMMELEQKREAENLVVGLLYIDNYDELIDSIDEIRQSLIMALIDRKINKYMQGIDAISKKLEKDKFLFLFKQSYLAEICSNRFAILEEIRDINLGNESSATISIGIGVGRDTFVERYDLARAAIDLALGRGGDQAVVKSVDQEKFYGGKSVQIERNTRVKARVKAHALKELIEGKERVVVMGHSIGDVDSFGAFKETSYSTPQNFKNALGHLAYILEGIKEIPAFTPYTVCVEADGQIYKDSYIFGAVSNARSVGGILKISDSLVDLNDGVFEVMMIKMPKTLMDLSAIVTSLTSLNPLKYDPSMFLFLQTKELKITFEQEMVWSLDGERVSGGKEARIACIKDAFKILTV